MLIRIKKDNNQYLPFKYGIHNKKEFNPISFGSSGMMEIYR
jgi:hypothetical protein